MTILESLEFKISSLEQQFDSVSKKLIDLISLLRHTINQDARNAGEKMEGHTGDNQSTLPAPSQEGKAKASTGPDTSKNYIVLEMY